MVNTLDYNSYSASYMKEGTQWKNTAVDDNSIKAFNKFNGGISKGAWDIIEEDGNGGVNNIDWSKYISENKVDMAFLNSKNLYVYKSDNKYFLLSLSEVKEIKDGQEVLKDGKNIPKQSIEINNSGASTLVSDDPNFKLTTGVTTSTSGSTSSATDKALVSSFQVMLGIKTVKVNWNDADNDKKIDYDEVILEDNGKEKKLSETMTEEFFNIIDTNKEGDNKGLDSDEIVKATEMLNKGESLGYNRNQYFESKKLETNMTVPVGEKKSSDTNKSPETETTKSDANKSQEPEKTEVVTPNTAGSASEGNVKYTVVAGDNLWKICRKVNPGITDKQIVDMIKVIVADKENIFKTNNDPHWIYTDQVFNIPLLKKSESSSEPNNNGTTNNDGPKTDGTGTDGTGTDGTKTDGTKTDGTKTDGTKTEGTKTDGTKTDGTKTDGTTSPDDTNVTEDPATLYMDLCQKLESKITEYETSAKVDLKQATNLAKVKSIRNEVTALLAELDKYDKIEEDKKAFNDRIAATDELVKKATGEDISKGQGPEANTPKIAAYTLEGTAISGKNDNEAEIIKNLDQGLENDCHDTMDAAFTLWDKKIRSGEWEDRLFNKDNLVAVTQKDGSSVKQLPPGAIALLADRLINSPNESWVKSRETFREFVKANKDNQDFAGVIAQLNQIIAAMDDPKSAKVFIGQQLITKLENATIEGLNKVTKKEFQNCLLDEKNFVDQKLPADALKYLRTQLLYSKNQSWIDSRSEFINFIKANSENKIVKEQLLDIYKDLLAITNGTASPSSPTPVKKNNAEEDSTAAQK